jgi:RNA polymerase sigma-70 factor (ECF subfamily)
MSQGFLETRWTLVARSRGQGEEARLALRELCEAYYGPVVAFLRKTGRDEDGARELAHDFFAKLLQGGSLDHADPSRGRFRSYLLAALKHFAADDRDRRNAVKRGGGREHAAIIDDELPVADHKATAPDAAFDRQWALTLLARALGALEGELRTEGKEAHFAVLKPWLTLGAEKPPQAMAAATLGMSESAVKVAIHRLRQRFRDRVRGEISQTVAAPGRIEDELEALRMALRSDG